MLALDGEFRVQMINHEKKSMFFGGYSALFLLLWMEERNAARNVS
jgi:hypothetical protein